MLYRLRHFRWNVLNQCAPARDIQYLHPETDREQGHPASFDFLQYEQISFVLDWVDATESRVRLASITKRIHIGVTARQKDAVKFAHDGCDVITFRNQADMDRVAPGRGHGLAVVARKVKTIRLQFDAHRDADAW